MVTSPAFQRARSAENKAHRRSAILEAGRALASERGVGNVSLTDIAGAVDITKSNVLRYFETREDLYLQLTAAGYAAWASRVVGRLDGCKNPGPDDVATALAEGLADDPLFCDLLTHAPVNLEHNISAECARGYKLAALSAVEGLAADLVEPTGLSLDHTREIVIATVIHATGLWPICNPPPAIVELYASDPRLRQASLDFVPRLRRLLAAAITGLPALDAPARRS